MDNCFALRVRPLTYHYTSTDKCMALSQRLLISHCGHFGEQAYGTHSETSHRSPWTLQRTSVWHSVKDLSPITMDTSTDRCMAFSQRPLTYHRGHFHGKSVWHRVRDLSPTTVDTSTDKCMAPRQRPLTYHRGHSHGQVYGTQSKTSHLSPWTLPRTGV